MGARRLAAAFLAGLLFSSPGTPWAAQEDVRGKLRVKSDTGSVDLAPRAIVLPASVVTDNGDGTVTISAGGGDVSSGDSVNWTEPQTFEDQAGFQAGILSSGTIQVLNQTNGEYVGVTNLAGSAYSRILHNRYEAKDAAGDREAVVDIDFIYVFSALDFPYVAIISSSTEWQLRSLGSGSFGLHDGTANAYRLFVTSANKLGVGGTTAPTETLTVSGGRLLLDNNQALLMKDSGGTSRQVAKVTSGDVVQIGDVAGGYDLQLSAGVNFAYLTSGGKLGVGTASPQQTVEARGVILSSGSGGSDGVHAFDGDTSVQLLPDDSGGSAERAQIKHFINGSEVWDVGPNLDQTGNRRMQWRSNAANYGMSLTTGTPVFTLGVGASTSTFRVNTSTFTGGAQTGTLLNSPTAGNPAGYWVVQINGVTSYIPFWQ